MRLSKETRWLLVGLAVLTLAFLIFQAVAGGRTWLKCTDLALLPVEEPGYLSIAADGTVLNADTRVIANEFGLEVIRRKAEGFSVETRRLGSNEMNQVKRLLDPQAVYQERGLWREREFTMAAVPDGSVLAFGISNRVVICGVTNSRTSPASLPGMRLFELDQTLVDLAYLENGNLLLSFHGEVQSKDRNWATAASALFDEDVRYANRVGRFAAVTITDRNDNRRVKILDSETLRIRGEFEANANPIAVSPGGRLAIASEAGHIAVTTLSGNAQPSAAVSTFLAPAETSALEFIGEDTLLAAGGQGVIYICRKNEDPKRLMTGHSVPANNVSRISAASGDTTHGYTLLVQPRGGATPYLMLIEVRSPKLLATVVWAVLSVAAVTWWWLQRHYRKPRAIFSGMVSPKLVNELAAIKAPVAPDELLKALESGDCVLYAGAGLSAQSGFPVWSGLLGQMVEWAVQHEAVNGDLGESLRAAIRHGDLESASEGLLEQLGDQRDSFYQFLQKTLLGQTSVSRAHKVLRELPFSAVLTTNLDGLIEAAFAGRQPPVFTPRDTDSLLASLSSRTFFILKLYGEVRSPETIILSAAQFEEAVASNRAFSSFMETLFFSRTLLFVGASLEGIEDYLKAIRFSKTRLRTHYALVDVSSAGSTWELKGGTFRKKYGIELIPYSPTEGHPEVVKFLEDLAGNFKKAKGQDVPSGVSPTAAPARSSLKRLILDRIGPFDHLELNLDAGWNVLLGDNGVGKSNILKAIAVAICGRDAQPYASRLIKVGETSGTILLETDRGAVYKTELQDGEITSTPGRPLEAEGWLAIGFPPWRMFSWERPASPEAPPRQMSTERRPAAEDLLPLIQGVPDPRMNKLKQWLLNLDYWIKDAREKMEDSHRYEALREQFFTVVRKLAVGTQVEYARIDPGTYEVRVKTSDGELPLEAISQGTAALLGWVGILLQRLYEVAEPGANPLERYAIVLIDELDAHMHPAWQQALISLLQDIFPRIQFIGTTHSPFLAIGRQASEIVRFRRDAVTGKVVVETAEHDTTKMSVANVLTSYLFGLQSLLGYDLQKDLMRKRSLSIKPALSEQEREDLATLTERLKDVDATAMIRDPLFPLFVQEMTRRREEKGEGAVTLTKEENEQQRLLAREILDRLVQEKEELHETNPALKS